MNPLMEHLESIGIALFVIVAVIFRLKNSRNWERDVKDDFEAALLRINIDHYEFLVDRTVPPGPYATPEAHRIFHDRHGNYFFYQYMGDGPGILKPLTKERALLAARMGR